MEIDMQTTVVKLNYEGEMRRFPFQGESFNGLYGQIISLLTLEQGAELVVKYIDEEGDMITISSDLELKSAIVPGKLLRISVMKTPAEGTPQVPTITTEDAFRELGFDPSRWSHPRRPFSKDEWEMLKKHKKERKLLKHQGGPYHGPFPGPSPFGPEGMYFGPHRPHGRGHHGPYEHREKHCKKDKKYLKEFEKEKLFARFTKDVTVEDGYQLAPNVPFVKTWRLRNEGAVPWPVGSVLALVGKHSDNLGGPESIPVAPIAPGEEADVSVNLCSPDKPGRYTGYWRMCTAEGRKFGQRVWVSIVVPSADSTSSESDKEADRLEALVDVVLGNEQFRSIGIKRQKVYRLLKRCNGDIEKVLDILNKKVAKKQMKCKH